VRTLAAVALACALLGAAGCDQMRAARTPFKSVDVTGAPMGDDLRLTDHNGKPRSLADFRGKVVVVNFGYTQCPDVCPTTLSDLSSAVKKLGADASRVQVLFVTVDPKRDTAELLKQYVPAFNADFIGMRGDEAATTRVTKAFRVFAQERAGKTPQTYTVDHTAQSFVFDANGKLRLVMGYGMKPDDMAADLRILLNS
jgi:protein SCO1/2